LLNDSESNFSFGEYRHTVSNKIHEVSEETGKKKGNRKQALEKNPSESEQEVRPTSSHDSFAGSPNRIQEKFLGRIGESAFGD
jgi:hypothetical protein